MLKHLIVIGGPTASGKTLLAIQLARHFNTEIISYDSRQFYREIPIVTAQPTQAQLNEIPHHGIAIRSVTEPLNAAGFAELANTFLKQVFLKSCVAIAVGGSGLYAKAWLEGFDDIPAVPMEIRQKCETIYAAEGIEALQRLLEIHDPGYYKRVDLANHRRLIRALEVCFHTGKPYSQFLNKKAHQKTDFVISYIGLNPDRNLLHDRINQRVDDMVLNGLFEEVMSLYPHRNFTPLQTVGCREIFEMMDGKWTHEECIERIKAHTRQYARRQITWYKKVSGIRWIEHIPKESEIPMLAAWILQNGV